MSEKSFLEKVEEYNNGEREKNPMDEVPDWKVRGIAGGLILSNLIALGLILSGENLLGVFIFLGSYGAVLLLTQGGRDILKRAAENMENQQQQQQSSSDNKRICSNCGWRNPQENKFCHDCGEELISSDEKDN